MGLVARKALMPLCLSVSLAAGADGGIDPAAAQIDVLPCATLFDEPALFGLEHFPPGATVTVRQHTDLWAGAWESEASFVTDAKGEIDVTSQAPISGAYRGVEPMGLFWSAHYVPNGSRALHITDTFASDLAASIDGKVVATARLQRRWASGGVHVRDMREDGLVGFLAEAPGAARHPGILLLGGSEGGYQEVEAALLASRGYTVLSLAYFGEKGLPSKLVKIPLEYLKKAIDWLRKRDSVDPEKIAVIGGSRGAELALLIGATFPEVKAVVALAPTHAVWSGIGFPYRVSAWTLHGEPLPYVQSYPSIAEITKLMFGSRVQLRDAFERGLRESDRVAAATIPVEKINGPVLLISGKDDRVWPSAEMADKVMQRLRDSQHAFADQHLSYEGAGHFLPLTYEPMEGNEAWAGGSAVAAAHAFADYHPRLLAFLDHRFGKPDLKSELEAMFDSDQALRARAQPLATENPQSKEAAVLMTKQQGIDQENLARLESIVASDGWPASSRFGGKAASAAFVVVQHADLETQRKYLPQLRAAAEAGEAQPDLVALLEDRVLVSQGQPQIYGSQLHANRKGGWEFDPIQDEAHVDERRKAKGLPPLAEYAKSFGIDYRPATP